MSEIKLYIEKVNDNTFSSSDVPLALRILDQDAKRGSIEFTKDDSHLFQVYTFLLQQLELVSGTSSPAVHAGDWRGTVDDLSLLKHVMDDMEREEVVSKVSWNAGGIAIFDIPDKDRYRTYVNSMMRLHLNRLYERYGKGV
ncbi:hypothetical protein [Methanolobus sp. WCC4]|uniref:hypothetical protein n=1 Tax=Methanolobus sp. WCC4 TaxID=3125784 RepID=UPI0030F54D8B